MDSELLDCFTPPSGSGHHDTGSEAEDARLAYAMRRSPRHSVGISPASDGNAGKAALDTVAALGGSLTPAMRADCRERAEKRAFAGIVDASDPCVCGEAMLLIEAAASGMGRAPAVCFERLGEML